MRLDVRVPEPELMENPEQAAAYDAADFTTSHDGIVADLLHRHPGLTADATLSVVDLGCGPADVTVRLARALPCSEVVGIDAGPRMLELGRGRIAREGLSPQVRLVQARVNGDAPPGIGGFGLIASNSLLHHLADPLDLWRAVRVLGAPRAAVHVADLRRPRDTDEIEALVQREVRDEHPLLQDDFRRSLAAAYRPDEVERQLATIGLDRLLHVEEMSDRHLVVWGRLPG